MSVYDEYDGERDLFSSSPDGFSCHSTQEPEYVDSFESERSTQELEHFEYTDTFRRTPFSQRSTQDPEKYEVPGYPDWYNVKFVGDPAIYTYKLNEDYEHGDLTILV